MIARPKRVYRIPDRPNGIADACFRMARDPVRVYLVTSQNAACRQVPNRQTIGWSGGNHAYLGLVASLPSMIDLLNSFQNLAERDYDASAE